MSDWNQPQTEVIKTKLLNVMVYKEDSGWFLAETENGENVTGISVMSPPTGTKLTLEGSWQNNAKWGRQFKVSSIRFDSRSSAVLALLKSGFLDYIKDAMADIMFKALGDRTFDVLDGAANHDPVALNEFMHIKGVGKVTGPAILDSWTKERDWVQNALICVRAGLDLKQSRKAHEYFGDSLVEIVKTNPYRLNIIRGIGWDIVDRIAQEEWEDKPAIAHDSTSRYAAAMREILARNRNNGHVCLPVEMAFAEAQELATPADILLFRESIRNTSESEALVFKIFPDGEFIYTQESWDEEIAIVENLNRILGAKFEVKTNWSEIESKLNEYIDVDLSEDQRLAVKSACENGLTTITGGPGCGKTTLIKAIANIFDEAGLSIVMCAPTGKAARRMEEATGFDAYTIHRALDLANPVYEHDFEADVVIMDESSMIDQWLFLKSMRHVRSGTRLILVGDGDQLPPVGPGEPFYQVLNMSNIPAAKLTQIHRQGRDSGIVHAAQAFNKGELPDVSLYDDCYIGKVNSNDVLPNVAVKVVDDLLSSGIKQSDMVVLTPVNGHPWGQEAINRRLKAKYNPGLPEDVRMPGVGFDIGDPVIHVKNNYNLEVMNGEAGIVTLVLTKEEEKEQVKADPKIVIAAYGDRAVGYTRDDLSELKLGYAGTVHKYQGDEKSVVVLLAPHTRPSHQTRQLIYTGSTRAKKYLRIISAGNALLSYIQNEERVRRYTNLKYIEIPKSESDSYVNSQLEPLKQNIANVSMVSGGV